MFWFENQSGPVLGTNRQGSGEATGGGGSRTVAGHESRSLFLMQVQSLGREGSSHALLLLANADGYHCLCNCIQKKHG